MTKIAITPLVYQDADGKIPGKFLPIPPDFTRHGNGAITQAEPLGDVLARFGAKDTYGLSPDTLVVGLIDTSITNVHCGGNVEIKLLIPTKRVSRMFGSLISVLYLSRRDDGTLETAIPG